MESFNKHDKKKFKNISVRNKLGKITPINDLPEFIEAKQQGEIAKNFSDKFIVDNKIIKLYQDYLGEEPTKETIKITTSRVAIILLSNGIITIRETQSKTKLISNVKRKLSAISDPLTQAQKALNSLDSQTRNALGMAIHSNKVDIQVISKIIDACESITNWFDSPTNYYIPILRTLQEFRSSRFSIFGSIQLNDNDNLTPKLISQRDWIFFTTLVTNICFEIFSTLDNPPENLNDTKKGLIRTFNKIKETKANYFSPHFPD